MHLSLWMSVGEKQRLTWENWTSFTTNLWGKYAVSSGPWKYDDDENDLYRKTKCGSLKVEIKRCRLKWLGNILRMENKLIPKGPLQWTPPGKRKQGRPRATWRRTVTSELQEVDLTWDKVQHVANDRKKSRQLIYFFSSVRCTMSRWALHYLPTSSGNLWKNLKVNLFTEKKPTVALWCLLIKEISGIIKPLFKELSLQFGIFLHSLKFSNCHNQN